MSHDEREAWRKPTDGGADWLGSLSGAPLDLIKIAAALFMLGDHVNAILLDWHQGLLWRFGRIAFPLFCFVSACHLARTADPGRYLLVLLVAAIPTQPIFGLAFGFQIANVLFTLAAGAALATALRQLPTAARHLIFAAGLAATLGAPLLTRTGVDFGLAGILLPAAMLFLLTEGKSYLPWVFALLFTLNAAVERPTEQAWWFGPAADGLFATFGGLVVIAGAALLRGTPRFLPRLALHLFYPLHLAVLAALRWAMA